MADSLLFDTAETLLETVVEALDTPPERQFVTDGDPMSMYGFCELVAVAMAPNGLFQSINVAARGNSLPARPTTKTALPQLVLKVWVITDICWPTQEPNGDVPPAADITSHAETVLTDRQDVWAHLRAEALNGTLCVPPLANGNNGAAVDPPATAFGPQGEVAGSIFTVYFDYLSLLGGS
jgi:hypothetical protein